MCKTMDLLDKVIQMSPVIKDGDRKHVPSDLRIIKKGTKRIIKINGRAIPVVNMCMEKYIREKANGNI